MVPVPCDGKAKIRTTIENNADPTERHSRQQNRTADMLVNTSMSAVLKDFWHCHTRRMINLRPDLQLS